MVWLGEIPLAQFAGTVAAPLIFAFLQPLEGGVSPPGASPPRAGVPSKIRSAHIGSRQCRLRRSVPRDVTGTHLCPWWPASMERVTICGAIGLMSHDPGQVALGNGARWYPSMKTRWPVRLVEAQGQALLAGTAGTADVVRTRGRR